MTEPTEEQPDTPMRALEEAIGKCASVSAFAQRIGVGQSTVSMWKSRGRVAAEYVPAIYRETGVDPKRLRPDIPWEVLREQADAPWDGTERRTKPT